MIPIDHQLLRIRDLQQQRDMVAHRFHNREAQAILLELIAKELDTYDNSCPFPLDIILSLSNPELLLTKDIQELCCLYKNILLSVHKAIEPKSPLNCSI